MPDEEVAALREEMSRRGLPLDDAPAPEEPYRDAGPARTSGPPCPTCAGPMVEGKVELRRSAGWHGGLVATDLFFAYARQDEGGGGGTTLFHYEDTPAARLCNGCGTVVILGRFADR